MDFTFSAEASVRGSVHSHGSPPTGVGQSLLLRAAVDGRLFVACLQAARQEGLPICSFLAGKASPNGTVQKRQLLLSARNRGGNLLVVHTLL